MSAGRRPARAWARAACALALGSLAACSPTAAPVAIPALTAEPQPLAAVQIAARVAAPGLADLTGLEVDAARARLDDTGLVLRAVHIGDSTTVTAQFPTAGTPAPADGLVTVWVGEPAQPPPARRAAPEPALPSPAEATAQRLPTPAPTPTAVPPPAPGARVLTGRASWYGPGFAGRTTACGDPFDPQALTLASRELPCGTRVRITGPAGAHVDATVTDWGPAEWTGRRFDLSQATFAAIAPLGAGVVAVTVEVRS